MSTPERVVRNLHRLLFAHSVALIRHNVRSVVTVEFNVPSVDAELTAAYGWTAIHYDDFVHKTISPTPGQSTPYDIIASFSSLEHTGLGRYGDPLDPQGDITAVGHIHRALKLGGLFVFGGTCTASTALGASPCFSLDVGRWLGTETIRWRHLVHRQSTTSRSLY